MYSHIYTSIVRYVVLQIISQVTIKTITVATL